MDQPTNGGKEEHPFPTDEKFYVVTRERPKKRGMFTSKPHPTASAAKTEAERLAEKHPGVIFYVFGLIAVVRRKKKGG